MYSADKITLLIEKELGHVPRLPPTTMAASVCKQMLPLLQSPFGAISPDDGLFLLSLIETARPQHLLEIGVMAGVSTLFMLRYLDAVGSDATLTSVDAVDYYLPDPSKTLAFQVFDALPVPPARWTLIGCHGAATMAKAPQLEKQDLRRRYDFVFVDAHHGHPWPVLDTLCLLPYTAAGSWIALHDVALTLIDEKYACRGPQYLLQGWPLPTWLAGNLNPNIGAIRLSDAGPEDASHLLKILEIPWEYGLARYWEDAILTHLRSYLSGDQMDRLESAFIRHRSLDLAPKL